VPYIPKDRRTYLMDHGLADLLGQVESEGELNYVFTELALDYAEKAGFSYSTFNTLMGVFPSTAAEFYRRVVAPYEDAKRKGNGDVYS
jgi:hypothetical protein